MTSQSQIALHIDIQASPKRVFEALTTAEALEAWFSERASVSMKEGRYDFWGRHTPAVPDANAGRHSLRSWEEDRSLSYTWRFRGADTVVALLLEMTAEGTRLSLTHDAPERGEGELSLADFWMLSLENLRRFLRNGAPPLRRDYASPSDILELSLDIEAPPDRVFHGLTDPESLALWMSATVPEVEARVGGAYRYWEGMGPVEVLEIEKDRKLSCRWSFEGYPDSVVTWTLDGSGGRTRLTLVHSGFGREVEDFRTGWLKHLVWLKEMVEQSPSWAPPTLLTTNCRA